MKILEYDDIRLAETPTLDDIVVYFERGNVK
jgi:hypothetical protein